MGQCDCLHFLLFFFFFVSLCKASKARCWKVGRNWAGLYNLKGRKEREKLKQRKSAWRQTREPKDSSAISKRTFENYILLPCKVLIIVAAVHLRECKHAGKMCFTGR